MSAVATFKDVCLDAEDPALLGVFWASVLGRVFEQQADGDAVLTGPTDQHRIWINRVPESRTVKHRVHLDVYTTGLSDLERLGATVLRPEGEDRGWTVMADPEGGEFCAFLRAELPVEILHGLVVDSVAPGPIADWWAAIYGAEVVHHDERYATVQAVPGMPIETMDFVAVPEPKTVKNRIHWDVSVPALEPLIEAGATVVRAKGSGLDWHVMADPEGNEFCAFLESDHDA